MNLFLAILTVLSFAGFYLSYRIFIKDNPALFPILFIAGASVFSYVFGLVGLLKAGYFIVIAAGIMLIPLAIFKHIKAGNKNIFKLFMEPSLLFLLTGFIWAFVITRNVGLSHPDDFSHWYKICKVLHGDNAFPTNIDIRFTTYTPGTATWIYFFTNAAGFSVPNCLWAQSLINLACCCSFFSLIPPKKPVLTKALMFAGISACSVLLCSIDVSTYSLLVDCTLPLIALASVFYLYDHGFKLDRISIPLLVIILAFMELTKFSGLIFELFILILYLFKAQKKNLLPALAVFVLPVVITLLYRVRNSFIYANINVSNQAVSLERYSQLFSQKSSESVTNTIVNVFSMALNPAGAYAQVTIVWIIFAVLIILMLLKKLKKTGGNGITDYSGIFKYSFLVYLIYVFFLTLTYLFSMNAYEAEILSCCYRYMGSIAVFITGFFSYHIMRNLTLYEDKLMPAKMAGYIVMTIIFGHMMFGYNYIYEGRQQYSPFENFTDSTPWNKISEYADEKMEFTDARYLVIWDESYLADSNYLPFQIDYVAGSYLRSVKITTIMMSEMDDNKDLINEYNDDQIIIVGELNN